MSVPDKDSLQAGRILLSKASPTTHFYGNREATGPTQDYHHGNASGKQQLVASEALIRRGRQGRHERQCAANNAETVTPLGRVSNTNVVTELVAALSIRQMLPAE